MSAEHADAERLSLEGRVPPHGDRARPLHQNTGLVVSWRDVVILFFMSLSGVVLALAFAWFILERRPSELPATKAERAVDSNIADIKIVQQHVKDLEATIEQSRSKISALEQAVRSRASPQEAGGTATILGPAQDVGGVVEMTSATELKAQLDAAGRKIAELEARLVDATRVARAVTADPSAAETTRADGKLTHLYTVARGDNLSKIAQKLCISVDELRRHNPEIMDFEKLGIGQLLRYSPPTSPCPEPAKEKPLQTGR